MSEVLPNALSVYLVFTYAATLALLLALVACDVMTMIVLWRWLACTGRSEWLALAYAWNPLVVLEVAHSGHIDALGALWITASAYWLARRRTALASIAFVLAVATKLLPIVLVPLYWKRVRARDALAGSALLALLYLAFTRGGSLPSAPFRMSWRTSGSTVPSSGRSRGSSAARRRRRSSGIVHRVPSPHLNR